MLWYGDRQSEAFVHHLHLVAASQPMRYFHVQQHHAAVALAPVRARHKCLRTRMLELEVSQRCGLGCALMKWVGVRDLLHISNREIGKLTQKAHDLP